MIYWLYIIDILVLLYWYIAYIIAIYWLLLLTCIVISIVGTIVTKIHIKVVKFPVFVMLFDHKIVMQKKSSVSDQIKKFGIANHISIVTVVRQAC